MQDISSHVEALDAAARSQRELRMSEARYRTLVEQAPFSVQILSPAGRTIEVNAAWERLWGLTLHDLRDYNILEDPELVDRGLAPLVRRAFAGEVVQLHASPYDPKRLFPDAAVSSPRWVRAVMFPLLDEKGELREVVLVHEDMTEQVRIDEVRRAVEREREALLAESQRAARDAESASRVKDEFLAVLSHELRTPLNAVLGWARILRTRTVDEEVARALEVIERNARAQARLIDDLLDMSRIITGNIRLKFQLAHLPDAVRAALDAIRPAAEARRIRIAVDMDDAMPLVQCDPERVQQVFWNLLSNAVKFSEPGGQVTVRVWPEASDLHIVVSDTGTGIAPEVLPHVFERFRQGDSSSTRAYPGLGIGLAIVRHIVELHGGTVSAESAGPGTGATFRLAFPRRR
jgi:PAS domain S-box-containing protein